MAEPTSPSRPAAGPGPVAGKGGSVRADRSSWWIATFPGLAIFVTTLVINLMGNALRDPHLKM